MNRDEFENQMMAENNYALADDGDQSDFINNAPSASSFNRPSTTSGSSSTGAAYGAGIGGLFGGLMGQQASQSDFDAANLSAQKSVQELLAIGYPPDTAKALVLKQYAQAGQLTPELEKAIQAGPSALAAISEDPALKARQMSALDLISQRATGGLSPEDRAKFNEMRQQLATDQNAKQQQIIQQAQARGMGRSGAELAAALSNAQSGANQASAEGDRLAATASQNALQAALASGQLGGQIRQQDFTANSTRANAEDQMNRFNVQNQIGQQQRNVGAQNQAQQYNLTNKQNISNANTNQYNTEQDRQNNARLTDWKARAGYADTVHNAYAEDAKRRKERGQDAANMWGTAGAAAGTIIGGIYGGPMGAAAGNQIGGQVGGAAGNQMNASNGGLVPGEAKYPGNHPENDTVDAKLSPGEIVIPRHITQSDNAPEHAASYVALIKKAQEHGKKKH